MDFLQQLNESQQKAVTYIDGPSLVIAGAGSGKTRVLTYKIAYLLENGFQPWNILALTFTNKAAREMKERIARLIGADRAQYLQMGTFHSIFAKILRVEAQKIGFQSNYTIYDETDSRSLIKNIIKEMNLDDKVYKPGVVANTISMAKNRLITADDYACDREALTRDRERRMPALSQIFTAYQTRCERANAMDFDDLLVNTYKLLSQYRDVREKYQQRFSYVLVDEYQDTNYAQQKIVHLITMEHQHVCVVGDDAQSIYAFRGANIDNILHFEEMYQGTKVFKLERNYRSTQMIVQAANSLIRHNEWQIQKDVYSKKEEGEKIIYKNLYTDKEEAAVVCKEIKRLKRTEGGEYNDFAILYRTNAQSRSFEEQLRSQNIPYRIYGGLSFYQRKEIKDIIAYFRLVANNDDEEAFRRIINYPTRGIGNTTVAKISEAAHKNDISLWQVIVDPEAAGLKVMGKTWQGIENFRTMIQDFSNRALTEDVYMLGRDIVKKTGIYSEIYTDTSVEGKARQENVDELISGMIDFVNTRKEEDRAQEVFMADYLQEVALITDLDSENGDEQGRVNLMTIHSAKGLEFPTVFIVGMEENIFPSPLSANSRREMEEERRLLYVAITRAERHCYLTSAQNRLRYGKMEFNAPSRFIKDIDAKWMAVKDDTQSRVSYQNSRLVAWQFKADRVPKVTEPRRQETPVNPFIPTFEQMLKNKGVDTSRLHPLKAQSHQQAAQTVNTERSNDILMEGDVIEHARFGIGTVVKLEGSGENTKATVQFRNTGTKQLLLKFARFKVVR